MQNEPWQTAVGRAPRLKEFYQESEPPTRSKSVHLPSRPSITKVISKTIMVSFSGQTAVRLHQGCAHQPATRRGEKFPVPYNQFRTNETRSKCLE
jgi:hypothetical protein